MGTNQRVAMMSRTKPFKRSHRLLSFCALSMGAACLLLPLSKAGAQGDGNQPQIQPQQAVAVVLPQESMRLPQDLRQHYAPRADVVVPRWQQGIDATPRRAPFEFGKISAEKQKYEQEPPFHFLPNEIPSSRAIGRVNHGRLVHAATLAPESETWKILPRQRARNLNYGHQALVQLIENAAQAVARQHPESILGVGNIGRPHGGPIPYSVSHQVGHDADLAFYATDPNGNPTLLPDLLTFDDEGKSKKYNGYYRFDVARNWTLVEALIENKDATLQYLFISNGLRKLLLDYASTQEVDPEILRRAEILLRQPAKYIPHDDHLHLRIYCTPEDLEVGCEDFGAKHDWMPPTDVHVKRGVLNAAVHLDDPRDEVRLAAVMRLGMLKDFGWTKDVARRLDDTSSEVRREASIALLSMAPDHVAKEVGKRLPTETDAETIVRFLEVLSERSGNDAAQAIATWMQSEGGQTQLAVVYPDQKGVPLKLYAIDALAKTASLQALPPLTAALKDHDLEIRARAARAITMITNHEPTDFNWASPRRSHDACSEAADAWEAWIQENTRRYKTRLDMVLAGMQNAGYKTSKRPATLAESLAQAAGDQRPHIRENAQRMLMQMTGKYPPSLTWSPHDARYYWSRWVRRNTWAISAAR